MQEAIKATCSSFREILCSTIFAAIRVSKIWSKSGRAEIRSKTVKIDTFFTELKRRNVYKVAVAYAVAGWAFLRALRRYFLFSTFRTGRFG